MAADTYAELSEKVSHVLGVGGGGAAAYYTVATDADSWDTAGGIALATQAGNDLVALLSRLSALLAEAVIGDTVIGDTVIGDTVIGDKQ
jgi:hypothetical protein